MKCYLRNFALASSKIKQIEKEIQEHYETGGKCKYFGTSPIDDATIFLFPEFSAIYSGESDNVDEWESLLDVIKKDHYGCKYIDVFATL